MSNKSLDADVLAFLRRADQLLEQQPAASEDGGDDDGQNHRDEIIETVIAQVSGHELAAACHVFASSTMQRAIKAASDSSLIALATPLLSARHVISALTDKYGSHVIEALLAQVLPSLQRSGAAWEEGEASLAALIVSCVDALVADNARHLLAAMYDRYATHSVRILFSILAGQPPASSNTGGGAAGRKPSASSDSSTAAERVLVPESFGAALGRLAHAISSLDAADGSQTYGGSTLLDLAWHASASPALQALLAALPAESPPLFELCARLMRWPPAEGETLESAHAVALSGREGAPPSSGTLAHVLDTARDGTGSRLIEAVLGACRPWWRPLYAHCFRSKLGELANDARANHAVQALLSASPNAPSLGILIKELTPAVPNLLTYRPGVVLRMANESAKHAAGGKEMLKAIRTALAGKEEGTAKAGGAAFAKALLAVGSSQRGGGGGAEGKGGGGGGGVGVGAIGSRLVQALIAQPAGVADPLVQSVACLPSESVMSLARDPTGSRALEACLKGTSSASGRAKLAQSVCSSSARLARDRCGGFVLEAAFRQLPVDERPTVLEVLLPMESELRASGHGNALLKKLRFDHWKQHPESWQKGEQRARGVQAAFAEILAEEDVPKGKRAAPAGQRAITASGGGGDAPSAVDDGANGRMAKQRKAGRDDGNTPSARTADDVELDDIFGTASTADRSNKDHRPKHKGLAKPPAPAQSTPRQSTAPPERKQKGPKAATGGEGAAAAPKAFKRPAPAEASSGGNDFGFEPKRAPKKPRREPANLPTNAPTAAAAPASGVKMNADRAARLAAMFGGGGGGGGGGKSKGKKFSMA